MQIYSLIKNDHRKLQETLSELSDITEKAQKRRPQLLSELKRQLIPHSRAEEIVLYDELKLLGRGEAVYLAYEGYEEHRLCDHILHELESIEPDDPRWRAKFEVLKELLTHHIEDEEEYLLEHARNYFSEDEAVELAEKFLAMKKQLGSELPSQDDMPRTAEAMERITRERLNLDTMSRP